MIQKPAQKRKIHSLIIKKCESSSSAQSMRNEDSTMENCGTYRCERLRLNVMQLVIFTTLRHEINVGALLDQFTIFYTSTYRKNSKFFILNRSNIGYLQNKVSKAGEVTKPVCYEDHSLIAPQFL